MRRRKREKKNQEKMKKKDFQREKNEGKRYFLHSMKEMAV
jgi:hypothetical protein